MRSRTVAASCRGLRIALFRPFSGPRICQRLPPFAPALLHKCSTITCSVRQAPRGHRHALGEVEGGDEFGDRADGVLGELCRVGFRVDAECLADVALRREVGWRAESRLDLAEEIARSLDVVCELTARELRACLPGAAGAV